MKYSSLEYSEFILAFYLQLEHLKPKVNIFDGKKKNAIPTSGFKISRPFIFWLSC